MVFISLIQNIALLIALATIYQVIGNRLRHFSISQQIITGLLFGGVGVLVMMTPLNLMPGIIFDGRSIILSISGLYGGIIAAVISVVLCAVYRFSLGGDGAMVGIAVIVSSASIGLFFRYFFRRKPVWKKPLSFILFGLMVHVVMLLWMLALPQDKGITVIQQVGWAVILLYTPASVLICFLFEDYENQFRVQDELQISEKRFRMLAENAQDIVYRYEYIPRRGLTFISTSVNKITGYSPEEIYQEPDIFMALVHPEDRQIMQALLNGEVEFDQPLTIRWLTKDGRTIWTEQRNTQIHDQLGISIAIEGIIRDITASRAVEIALRKSEENYRLIAQNITDVILVMDSNLNVVYISPSIQALLDIQVEEILEQNISQFLAPESYQLVLDSLSTYTKDIGSGVEPEKRVHQIMVYRKDHSLQWVESSFSYINLPDESNGNIIAVLRDISDRKNAEEELNRMHELMSYIIEHDRGGIAVLDENLNYVYVSQQYMTDFKIVEQGVIGKNIMDIFPRLSKYWQDILRLALSGKTNSSLEDVYEHPDGNTDWIRWECRPWFRNTETVGGIILYTEIISDRKRAEEALQQSRDKLAKLTDQVPGMVYQFQMHPDGSYVNVFASSGSYDLYQLTPDQVVGDVNLIFSLIHPADIAHVNHEIQHSAENLQDYHVEFRVILPDQGVCWRLCDAKPEKLSDGSILWNGIVTDITERKHTEQKINEQMNELRRWNVAMLGREKRNLELKQEVNQLLQMSGEAPRYAHLGIQSEGQSNENDLIFGKMADEFTREKSDDQKD